jgi:hypothetical protein
MSRPLPTPPLLKQSHYKLNLEPHASVWDGRMSTDLAAGTLIPLSSSFRQGLSTASLALFFATSSSFVGVPVSSTRALGDHPGCPALRPAKRRPSITSVASLRGSNYTYA